MPYITIGASQSGSDMKGVQTYPSDTTSQVRAFIGLDGENVNHNVNGALKTAIATRPTTNVQHPTSHITTSHIQHGTTNIDQTKTGDLVKSMSEDESALIDSDVELQSLGLRACQRKVSRLRPQS